MLYVVRSHLPKVEAYAQMLAGRTGQMVLMLMCVKCQRMRWTNKRY